MKTPHWTDKITISDAARATRKNRATVARAVRDLPAVDGPGNAKFYDTWRLLQALYVGEGGPTYSEAHRLLTIARTKLVEREIQAVDAKTMPVEDHVSAVQHIIALFRAFLLDHENKTLLLIDIEDCHEHMVEFLISQLPEGERRAATRAFDAQKLAGIAERIEALRDKIQRSEHRIERDRLNKILRAAYAACRDNPNRATLEALEAAQDAIHEHDKQSAEHKYQVEHYPETVISDAKHKESQAGFRAKLLGGGPNGG